MAKSPPPVLASIRCQLRAVVSLLDSHDDADIRAVISDVRAMRAELVRILMERAERRARWREYRGEIDDERSAP